MRARTGLFILATLVLTVTSTWMMIGAPWAPAPESAFDARSGSSIVLLPDGRLLIVGGTALAGPLAGTETLYKGSFKRMAHMSVGRSRAGAVALADGRVLVTGGVTEGGKILNSAEIYDPASDSW